MVTAEARYRPLDRAVLPNLLVVRHLSNIGQIPPRLRDAEGNLQTDLRKVPGDEKHVEPAKKAGQRERIEHLLEINGLRLQEWTTGGAPYLEK